MQLYGVNSLTTTELKTHKKKISAKFSNIWKLNTLLSKILVKEIITRKIRKHYELNDNENRTYPNE